MPINRWDLLNSSVLLQSSSPSMLKARMRVAAALLLAACLVLPTALAQRRKSLNDDNFEHITQAATGQTTGVWAVNFCSPSASTCKQLAGAWEQLGKELLQSQRFLTTVDVHSSPRLTQRFGITSLPTVLLFRDRKMYRFEGRISQDLEAARQQLREFIEGGFAQVQGLEVPPEPAPFDWLVKAAQQKVEVVRKAFEAQDLPALAKELLPVLLVSLGVLLLMLASVATRKAKRD